jgi:uncharacterized membrane protein (DUF2068 family)
MPFGYNYKSKDKRIVFTFLFYTITGIIFFAEMILTGFPPHMGIIGILSIITAYGLFTNRAWKNWIITGLFFITTTFSVYTLYYTLGKKLVLNLSMILYLILSLFFTFQTLSNKRK